MNTDNVLFYSDLGPESDRCFPLVVDLALAQEARNLFILHVLHSSYRFRADIVEPGMAMSVNPEFVHVVHNALRDRYEPAMRGLHGFSFHVTSGVVGVEILRFVRKQRIDLVALAQHAAQSARSQEPGRLDAFLTKRCSCPVLFLAPGKRPLAVNGSEGRAFSAPARSNVISFDRYRLKRAQSR
jgi:hypothetical protein